MRLEQLLSQAANAKNAGDAVDRLVSAWNTNPTPELEDAIVALDRNTPPFDGDQARFIKAAKSATPSERGPLLAVATTGTLAEVTRRLELITEWTADPRTSRTILALLSGAPWSSDSSKPAWTAAFAAMVKQRDARFVAAAKTLPAKWKVRSSMRQWLERSFARAIEGLQVQEARPLSAKERSLLEAAVKRHTTTPAAKKGAAKDEAALLQAVYERPADDGPRAVLADLLQEKNDPRGEFIALQLANDARAKKLLAPNAKKWLGALAPVLGADVEFRRGFPAVGRTKFRHQADAEQYGNLAEWATLEELEWGTPTPIPRGQEPSCRFIGPAFRHLKIARGPHLPSLLDAKSPWALTTLEVGVADELELNALDAKVPTLFPALETLSLRNVHGAWFRKVRNLGSLGTLVVRGAPMKVADGWDVFKALPVKTFAISTGESFWRFSRGANGTFSKLRVELADQENSMRHEEYARTLPSGFLESFELVTGKKADPKAVGAIRAALGAAQKRWKGGKATSKTASTTPVTTPLRRLLRTFAVRDLPTGERVVVDVEGPQVLAKGTNEVLHTSGTEVSWAEVSPDGKLLAIARYREVELLSLPTLERVWKSASSVEDTRGLQFQGSSLWHFARTGSERFGVKSGKVEKAYGLTTRFIGLSDDGAWALRLGKGGGFEVGGTDARKSVAFPGELASFVADGKILIVTGPGKGPLTLHLVDARTQSISRASSTVKVDARAYELARSPSGRRALVVAEPGYVVIDTSTLEARLFKRKMRGFAAFASDDVVCAIENGVIETLKM